MTMSQCTQKYTASHKHDQSSLTLNPNPLPLHGVSAFGFCWRCHPQARTSFSPRRQGSATLVPESSHGYRIGGNLGCAIRGTRKCKVRILLLRSHSARMRRQEISFRSSDHPRPRHQSRRPKLGPHDIPRQRLRQIRGSGGRPQGVRRNARKKRGHLDRPHDRLH